ncbi:MAG: biotin/lipoyl-containing protein, partial [Pseudomonadota bacterium]
MAIKSITLPDIGNYENTPVIEVLVSPGDRVEKEDSLITLESDKATMEIPSPYTGEITKVLVKVDDTINQGDLIAEIDAEEESEAPVEGSSEEAPKQETEPAPAEPEEPAPA